MGEYIDVFTIYTCIYGKYINILTHCIYSKYINIIASRCPVEQDIEYQRPRNFYTYAS